MMPANWGWTTSNPKLKRPSPSSAWLTVKAPGVSQPGRCTLNPAQANEITCAAEQQGALFDMHRQLHAHAAADIFLQSGGSAESLGGMDDLGKAVAPRVKPGPDLPAGDHVFGHRDHGRHAR